MKIKVINDIWDIHEFYLRIQTMQIFSPILGPKCGHDFLR